MTDLTFGKGILLWQHRHIDRGDPRLIAARFEAARIQTVVVRLNEGARLLGGLEKLIAALRGRGIRIGGWGNVHLHRSPLQEARAVLKACTRYEPDFYLVRLERDGTGRGVQMFLQELKSAGVEVPLGLSSSAAVNRRPSFPWAEFLGGVDFVCPLVPTSAVDPLGSLLAAQQAYGALLDVPGLPMPAAAVDMLSAHGGHPTPAQLSAVMSACDSDPFLRGLLMCLGNRRTFSEPRWEAFAACEWNGAPAAVPPQPLGWAKVKAAGGLWMRHSPDGDRIGGLALGELIPIWAVTETRWAAVNQAADQWIFIGDPDAVATTLDGSAARMLPSTGVDIYSARVVTRRGLNVRDAVRGRVLRVLPPNAIVQVYEERDGWARVDSAQAEWVRSAFLTRTTA